MSAALASLRVRFVLLVLLALLPALGLLFYTASNQRSLAIETTQREALRLARLAAADQVRFIEGTRQLLIVLARLPEVRDDADSCDALLADLLREFPFYANLGVIKPDGRLSCSAVPPGGPVSLATRDYFQQAVETEEFAVGQFQIDTIAGAATIASAYPVLSESGAVVALVYAAIDLEWLNQFATEAQLPEDGILTVFDRDGTVLVRHPDYLEMFGRSVANDGVFETIVSEGSGVTEGEDENGRDLLYAFAALGSLETGEATAAYVSVAVPEATATDPAQRAFNEQLTRLGLLGAVVLIAAWVGGDLLVQRGTDANKAVVRRVYDAFGTGGVDILDDAVAEDFVDHDPVPGQAPGLVGLKQAVGLFRAAFPDGQVVVDDLIAERDRVVAHVTLRGTQVGEFFGMPATGQPISVEGIEVFRIAGGKIAESWSRFAPLVLQVDGVLASAASTPRATVPEPIGSVST